MAPLMRARILLVGLAVANAAVVGSGAEVNPIRKVVTMLQMMQNKVTAEGKAAKELYDKFMCYCETGKEALEKSIADAEAKITQLEVAVKEAAAFASATSELTSNIDALTRAIAALEKGVAG